MNIKEHLDLINSKISRKNLIPIEEATRWNCEYSPSGKSYDVYIGYLDILGIWRTHFITLHRPIPGQEQGFHQLHPRGYLTDVIHLGDECYAAIEVSVIVNIYGQDQYKTLYVPCALFDDLSAENASHRKIEEVVWEFFGAAVNLSQIDRIYFHGFNSELWSVSRHRVQSWE